MAVSRLRTGEVIAGVAGVLLLIVMFLPWLGIPDEAAEAAEGLGVSTGHPTTNAWKSFTFLDIGLLITVLGAIGLAALAAAGLVRSLSPAASMVSAALGALATLAILYRIINPINDASREYGIWLGLIAAAAIALGGWRSMVEERTPQGERQT